MTSNKDSHGIHFLSRNSNIGFFEKKNVTLKKRTKNILIVTQKRRTVLRSYSCIEIASAQGLFKKIKITIVYVNFYTTIIARIANELMEMEYVMKCFVSVLGGSHIGWYKEFGIFEQHILL